MITGYDGEGRKYYHPEPTDVGPIDISRGPVETNHSSVLVPIVLPERGEGGGGSTIAGTLAVIFFVLIGLGLPVFFWSKYVWIPILGRRDEPPVSISGLLKGVMSGLAWAPFCAWVGLPLWLMCMVFSPFESILHSFPPAVSFVGNSAFLLDSFGAVYQRMNGKVTQEFLQSHLTAAERYTGSFLYQGLGFVALVVLAFVMRDRKAKIMNSGEELSNFRFCVAAFSPVVLGILFWSFGWVLLGSFLFLTGLLFIGHLFVLPQIAAAPTAGWPPNPLPQRASGKAIRP
jgi:hypothetical protein